MYAATDCPQLELIQGPDLLECINQRGASLPEDEAAYYFCQLLRGLLFMHQTGFAHRDLKPENCVLQHKTGVVKVRPARETAALSS